MKDYQELTTKGKIRRLRSLGEAAIAHYGLGSTRLTFLQHGENTTFCVASTGSESDRRYLLKLHRPGYQTEQSIRSEFLWLEALGQDGLDVPAPVRTSDGDLIITISVPGVPEPWTCSVTEWVDGWFAKTPRPVHNRRLGHLMAQIHGHARSWQPPRSFERRHWDWDGLFGANGGFIATPEEVWQLLPSDIRTTARRIADRLGEILTAEPVDEWGLVHADLHLGNCVFVGSKPIPIDFDDCGYAPWAYDIAVPLADAAEDPGWRATRDLLLEGYQEVAPLPGSVEHLETYMAGRLISLLLWASDLAQHNQSMAKGLPGWTAWTMESIGNMELG